MDFKISIGDSKAFNKLMNPNNENYFYKQNDELKISENEYCLWYDYFIKQSNFM